MPMCLVVWFGDGAPGQLAVAAATAAEFEFEFEYGFALGFFCCSSCA